MTDSCCTNCDTTVSLVNTQLYDDGGRRDKNTYGNDVEIDYDFRLDNLIASIKTTHPAGGPIGLGPGGPGLPGGPGGPGGPSLPSTVDDYVYDYDENGNKISETISGGVNGLSDFGFVTTGTGGADGYDGEDRVTNWTRTDGFNRTWDLSKVGDWSSHSDSVNGTVTRKHNGAHETEWVGNHEILSDAKGNIVEYNEAGSPDCHVFLGF